MRFSQFFSLDSPKAIKARSYGWMNAINYMAPASTAGVGNLCPWSTAPCRNLCLGPHSGRGVMTPVRASRAAKARMFMRDRPAFMRELEAGIVRARRAAARANLKLCIRLNGATDIAWERVAPHIFSNNTDIQFVDYTKSPARALAHAQGKLPPNYHLTFSRSETNEAQCDMVLKEGGNVAVVFECKPTSYRGARVIDGDQHDLRHLDPTAVVVALTPKGTRAKRDQSGFVVR